MAFADYYLCDVCGCKTFYDANLPYNDFGEPNGNAATGHPWPDGNVGFMIVLCKDCAEENQQEIEDLIKYWKFK